jgi:oligopeptide transport system substrate-binding protein
MAALALTACTPQASSPAATDVLSSDQTLSFPISQDMADLDPALISNASDVDILRNVFSGLYRYDDRLQEVPDIAAGMPAVSPDGLTYTFRLRQNARFSNGDPITAGDFIYSWDRAASKQGDYAWLFGPVVGYQAVAAGKTGHMSGLSKLDDLTLVVTLARAAGYFTSEVALWPFWVVDQQVVNSAGDDVWFARPQTLVGSGPFRMTSRTPGQSIDFAPVPGWYGGRTGALTRVHIEVVADAARQVTQYENGVFSLIGYARQGLSTAAATLYSSKGVLAKQLSLVPFGLTWWVGFNLKTGPLAGDAGRDGRRALSAAIDRNALVDAVCVLGTLCTSATGGLVAKGLKGYLGDGVDPNAKFDAAAAKAAYQAWDPDGAKLKGLSYTYDTSPFNEAVCTNLVAQWKRNLGVNVACIEVDRRSFLLERNGNCSYGMFRQSWAADYDHPHDWFDNLFVSAAGSSGSCYSNSGLDQLVAGADAVPVSQGLIDYRTAGQILVDDVAFAPLLYAVQPYLVHPYVRGAGGNALYDNSWTSVRVLAS